MKILVILPLILLVVKADSADKQDVKTKTSSPPLNMIQQSPKYEMFFQPVKYQQQVQQIPQHILQPIHHIPQVHQIPQKAQYVPVQVVPKQYYVTQPQPQAMIIIAQPTLLPQSLVYGNPTQQLLNYFHSNPQAKYQLLHGNYQQQQQPQQQSVQQVQQVQQIQPVQSVQHVQPLQRVQPVQPTPTFMHHVVAAPTIGSYILTPAPQLQHVPVAHHVPLQQALTQHAAPQTAPAQVAPVTAPAAHYSAQHSAQHNTQHNAQHIAQHNAQQTNQLGNIAQLAQLAAQHYVSNQLKTAPAIVTGFEHFTPEQQAQIKAQLATHLGTNFHAVSNPVNQYSAKYVARQQQQQQQEQNPFIPSPQIKNDQVTTVSSTNDILKTRYVNSKN